jgi:hypothetical protein
MSRDLESLIDIKNAAQRIKKYVDGISRSALEENDEKLSAILIKLLSLVKLQNVFPLNFGHNILKCLGEKWLECGMSLCMNTISLILR